MPQNQAELVQRVANQAESAQRVSFLSGSILPTLWLAGRSQRGSHRMRVCTVLRASSKITFVTFCVHSRRYSGERSLNMSSTSLDISISRPEGGFMIVWTNSDIDSWEPFILPRLRYQR